jgi:hypothetical protein
MERGGRGRCHGAAALEGEGEQGEGTGRERSSPRARWSGRRRPGSLAGGEFGRRPAGSDVRVGVSGGVEDRGEGEKWVIRVRGGGELLMAAGGAARSIWAAGAIERPGVRQLLLGFAGKKTILRKPPWGKLGLGVGCWLGCLGRAGLRPERKKRERGEVG